jgi:hypothetical protein
MKTVFVVQGTRRRDVPEHVAKLMVTKYGWSYEVSAPEVSTSLSVKEAKSQIEEAETVEAIEALLTVERKGLNRASVIRLGEAKVAELLKPTSEELGEENQTEE